MDWVKLAFRYYLDPKVQRLDDTAELLFVRGLARAGERGEGGFIAESDLPLLARRRRVDRPVSSLLEEGLWTKVAGGYRVANWSDWQDSLDVLTERRRVDRERKRASRAAAAREADRASPPAATPLPAETPAVRGQSEDMSADLIERREKDPPANAGGQRARTRASLGQLTATAHSPAAHRIVSAYADTCRKRPPSSVLTELAVQIDHLLGEQWSEAECVKSLALWGTKRLGPKQLHTIAHEWANQRPSTNGRRDVDQEIRDFLARGDTTTPSQLPPGGGP